MVHTHTGPSATGPPGHRGRFSLPDIIRDDFSHEAIELFLFNISITLSGIPLYDVIGLFLCVGCYVLTMSTNFPFYYLRKNVRKFKQNNHR